MNRAPTVLNLIVTIIIILIKRKEEDWRVDKEGTGEKVPREIRSGKGN